MSHSTSHLAPIIGHAVVRLKTGHVYVGHCAYDGRAITVDGSLRVVEIGGVVSYRKCRKRTIPFALVRDIAWDDDAAIRA